MIQVNPHYAKLQASYLFSEIARRVTDNRESDSDLPLIRLGIGDVTLPLPAACREAMHAAVDEMGVAETFRGYGPEQGYPFLREAIAAHDYRARGAAVAPDEIFISDGAKCDTGNFQELFASALAVAVPDPVYPVYVDTNVMSGRTGGWRNGRYDGLTYLDCLPGNRYMPELPCDPVDLIYLCFPNNPTGAVASRDELARWVAYAHENRALILFDAAYEAFIRASDVPRTIYEIDGAREVAVEFRSFSKTAGFTGTRCAFTVVPRDCRVYDSDGQSLSLHALWTRRHTTKFNGVSYPVQRAAEAVYSEDGRQQVRALIDYYMENAALIRQAITDMGYTCAGGEHSPYIWVYTGGDSWSVFDRVLSKARVVTTPGAGFGRCGEGHIRISAFNCREQVEAALERLQQQGGLLDHSEGGS